MDMDDSAVSRLFNDMVQDLEGEFDLPTAELGPEVLLSLEEARLELLECLADHLIAMDATDTMTDEEADKVAVKLAELIHRDFELIDEIKLGTEIQAGGNTVILIADTRDGNVRPVPMDEPMVIRGRIGSLKIAHIPDISMLAGLRDDRYDPETNPVVLNQFGLVFTMVDARFIHEDEEETMVEGHWQVVIPLNYPQTTLHKVSRRGY